jgi:hypothetical protein
MDINLNNLDMTGCVTPWCLSSLIGRESLFSVVDGEWNCTPCPIGCFTCTMDYLTGEVLCGICLDGWDWHEEL